MNIWFEGGVALSTLALATATLADGERGAVPYAGPLYACMAAPGSAGGPPVVAWAEGDGVVVVAGRRQDALPAYVLDHPERWAVAPQRLKLPRSALQARAAALTVPSGLTLACVPTSDD